MLAEPGNHVARQGFLPWLKEVVCEILEVTKVTKKVIFEEEIMKIIIKAYLRSNIFFITSPEP